MVKDIYISSSIHLLMGYKEKLRKIIEIRGIKAALVFYGEEFCVEIG